MLRHACSAAPGEKQIEPQHIEPADVYTSLTNLERAYYGCELGASRELTKDNLEYSDVLSKKLRALGKEVSDARVKR